MDRIFAFEQEFADGLRCIPMVVRRKLDLAGVKLSLAQWSRFPLETRTTLVEGPAEGSQALATWKASVEDSVRTHAGEEPKSLAIEDAPAWLRLDAVPSEVSAWAVEAGVELSFARWRSLDDLQRFALTKLSRPGHENRNFLPACKEFHLV